MKKVLLAAAIAGTVALTGCASTNQYQHSSQVRISTVSNYDTDIAIGQKINGNANGTVILGLIKLLDKNRFADNVGFSSPAPAGSVNPFAFIGNIFASLNPTEALKAAAAQNAIDNAKVDTILAPRYTVTRTNYFIFSTYKVDVNGFGGNVKGFRHIDAEKLAK